MTFIHLPACTIRNGPNESDTTRSDILIPLDFIGCLTYNTLILRDQRKIKLQDNERCQIYKALKIENTIIDIEPPTAA